LAVGNSALDLSAVVLGLADVVGDVVSKNHLVTVSNLDRFVVGNVLDTRSGCVRNFTARLHGHGLSKSSDDLEPVLVLHAFVLAGFFPRRPHVVVLSSGSSLKFESLLSEFMNLLHGELTLLDEGEGSNLRLASLGSLAPCLSGSILSSLAAFKRVFSPESVKFLSGSFALRNIEFVVSLGVLESDLHDVVMDSLLNSLGLNKGSLLLSSFLGSLLGSSLLSGFSKLF